MSAADPLDMTATAATEALASGELGSAELFDAYRARAQSDELNCFTWVAVEQAIAFDARPARA